MKQGLLHGAIRGVATIISEIGIKKLEGSGPYGLDQSSQLLLNKGIDIIKDGSIKESNKQYYDIKENK